MKTLFFLFWYIAQPIFAQKIYLEQIEKTNKQVINCVAVDEKNVKWFGTEAGLFRIEGEKVEKIPILSQDTSLYKTHSISAIHIDYQGNKWLGTYHGKIIKLTEKGTQEIYEFNDFVITAITSDQQSKIWASSWDGGLFAVDVMGGKINYHTQNSKITENQLFTVFTDQNNTIWLGTANGLLSVNKQKFEKQEIEGQITAITENEGSLYVISVGGYGSELWQYENFRKWKLLDLPEMLKNTRIDDLCFDKNNQIWLAADKIAWKNDTNWKIFDQNDGFSSQSAFCITADKQNVIWIGTEGKGVFRTQTEKIAKKLSLDDLISVGKLDENFANEQIPLKISFARGSDQINLSSEDELNKIAQILSNNMDWNIEIAGHTDNIGDQQKNLELSQKRTQAVKLFLVVKKNIDSSRISCVGYGGSRPIADNRREEDRQLNRRVEMKLIKKK